MAYRAGAQLRDMEFTQFHPTVLYIAGGSRSLITEAVRGEGGWLVDKDDHRFMPDYDPRAELAPRDVVSQSIVSQMEKTRHPCVYLDVTHLDAAFVLKRFPGIAAACKQFGIDITKDKIPVRPGAHYMIGGVTIDTVGQTTIPALWAAGEVSSSGLHGANRLASNSLLEGLVYGAHAGVAASRAALEKPGDYRVYPLENPVTTPPADLADIPDPKAATTGRGLPSPAEPLDLADIRNSLKSLMWRNCGVRRSGELLAEALESVDGWRKYVLARQFDDSTGWELQNMLTLARVMIQAALLRQESRGVHLRTDHPNLDDAQWNKHLWFQRSEANSVEHCGSA
jgi:L-aspartate oxidase